MIADAHAVQPANTVLQTDVCIVGAGAAGITLAREFVDSRLDVVLLESGGLKPSNTTQDLYAGNNIGRPYLDLTTCRLRYFGGTTNHWGGWCAPLDAADFERRESFPHSGWPFDRAYLEPWYRRAQEVCQLGPFEYAPHDWGIDTARIPPPFRGPCFRCQILQLSAPTRFGEAYRPMLQGATRLTVYLKANAVKLVTDASHRQVREVFVKTLAGHQFTVRARIFVVACGGIENARLLLSSGPQPRGLGNDRDLVGRFFMVHLQYHGGELWVSDSHARFDFDTGIHGASFRGFGPEHRFVSCIGLTDPTLRRLPLSNFKVRQAYAAPFLDEAEQWTAQLFRMDNGLKRLKQDIRRLARDLERNPTFEEYPVFSHAALPLGSILLRCQSEQLPNPNSRISLAAERDALGLRRVVLDWQLTREDRARAAATLRLLGAEVGRVGLGRVRSWLPDSELDWPSGLYGDQHHAGTTRMHSDPAQGVVNANCAVHGVDNLYIAGSSVFPTLGGNNPTLTITALALRLADHIKERLT